MSENLMSITITVAILTLILVFVPCLELMARGCRRINRSRWPARKRKDEATAESQRNSQQANSRSSNAA
jgi:hypothetical protein